MGSPASKRCAICKVELPITSFNAHKSRKDGLQPACRPCNAAASKAYYERNKAAHKRNARKNSDRYRAACQVKMLEYLGEHPCVDCGEDDPRTLEFDHQRDKVANVAALLSGGNSWARILEEIEKCDVRCSNCHQRRTAAAINSYKHKAMVVVEAQAASEIASAKARARRLRAPAETVL